MKSEPLTFEHPLPHLKLYEMEPEKWRSDGSSPELFLVEESTVVPYMPPLDPIAIERRLGIRILEDGRCECAFELNQEVNDLYQLFFEIHRKNLDVDFKGKVMTLRCKLEDLAENYDYLDTFALPRARNEYATERHELVHPVFEQMKKQERRDETEAEVQTEFTNYQTKRNERTRFAEENGWSVPILVQNLNRGYREILENKFIWWSKVLDDATIRKYRALFELEFLIV